MGLSPNESAVYDALLKLGLSPAKNILSQTNLHRQILYDALESLKQKGLVSHVVQSNRRYFRAADPKNFLDYFERREKALLDEKKAFLTELPKLRALQAKKFTGQEASLYFGNAGIKSLLNDMIETGKEISTMGASDFQTESFRYQLQVNLPKFHRMRVKKKISLKILFSQEQKSRARELDGLAFTQARVLPREFTSSVSYNVYNGKVSMIFYGDNPFGVLIQSPAIADAQRRHFQLLWKIAKKN